MCSYEHVNSDEYCFTVRHWPALQEWTVTPHEFIGRADFFTAVEPGASGLLGAINHCLQIANGRPTAIVIEANHERYELYSGRPTHFLELPSQSQYSCLSAPEIQRQLGTLG